MTKPISEDLRQRVCEAMCGGLSGRQAALRFKVSASSVSRWNALMKARGSVAALPQGGDRRSGRIEEEATFILGQVAEKVDITLAELKEKLAARGVSVGIGTVWRFFDRRKITFKKSPRTRPSRNVAT